MRETDNTVRSLEKLVETELSNWPTEWAGFNWPGYTYEHTLRVRNLSVSMARQLGADEQIVELAALLHDIGRPEDGKHSDTGARRAEEVLSELGVDVPSRQRVCHIIETHLIKIPDIRWKIWCFTMPTSLMPTMAMSHSLGISPSALVEI